MASGLVRRVAPELDEGESRSVGGTLKIGAAIVGLLILGMLAIALGAALLGLPGLGGCPQPLAAQPGGSANARSIPADYLALYQQAGRDYGLAWNVLAGVGKVETDHGRLRAPGVTSGQNYAGAGGPMQFLQLTWNAFGVDGNRDGRKNRYDPADAIPGAANYLRHNGASDPHRLRKAIFAYNHAWWYVDKVLDQAAQYASAGLASTGASSALTAGCADAATSFVAPKGQEASGKWPAEAIGPDHITPRTRRVRDLVKRQFGVPKGIGCYRAGAGAQDHAVGRACDFMISNGSPSPDQTQLGYTIANWATANASRLGIHYVIYRRHIWNIQRAKQGWRQMEDRGGITANHFDHVHISVF